VILLGLTAAEKDAEVTRYVAEHGISKVFLLSPARFRFPCATPHDPVEWAEIILYRFFYRLLREIDRDTLVVVNECLRTQNRHELTYNCIRNFLNQTTHQIIFQRLPIIDTWADFAILFDLDTRSRWKREQVGSHIAEASIEVRRELAPTFHPNEAQASPRVHAQYQAEKASRFAELGLRDPHTLPRNLHLVGGKTKLLRVEAGCQYVGRNNRFQLPNLATYRETTAGAGPRTVFEWCHNFLDFADFLAMTGQTDVDVLTTDLPVDRWYLQRYTEWAGRIRDAYAALHG
jgi:hypothetical protein